MVTLTVQIDKNVELPCLNESSFAFTTTIKFYSQPGVTLGYVQWQSCYCFLLNCMITYPSILRCDLTQNEIISIFQLLQSDLLEIKYV